MNTSKKITVQSTEISVLIGKNDNDYISLTDMIKAKDGDFFISDWLRNRNTLEYIGTWEMMYNPNFNYGEFATIKEKAGLNNFKVSVKELVMRTNAICLTAKTGRYGGTYAHKDIAFHFGMWISPTFQLYIVPQFRSIIPCEVFLYIEVTFWDLSIDLGIFRSSWFLHRHKIPHPNQWGSMITTKKYCLFYEDFSVVGFICI